MVVGLAIAIFIALFGWGATYFDINEAGHVVARPLQENGASVEINDVIEDQMLFKGG